MGVVLQWTQTVAQRRLKIIPIFASAAAQYGPEEWRDAGQALPVGTITAWHEHLPAMVRQWDQELNAGLDITQIPKDLSAVVWYWRCDRGHQWRESTYSRTDCSRTSGRRVPRWKAVAGTRAACRRCVIEDYGLIFGRCGCVCQELVHVGKPQSTVDAWCPECKSLRAQPKPGDALHVPYEPPTSKAERALRALLGKRIPIASPGEVNVVKVHLTGYCGRREPLFRWWVSHCSIWD